jgi:hypothetical protein
MTTYVISTHAPATYELARGPRRNPLRHASSGLMCLNLAAWVYTLAASANVLH